MGQRHNYNYCQPSATAGLLDNAAPPPRLTPLVARNEGIMKKNGLIADLTQACNDDTLMTRKHDPQYLGQATWGTYRTVLSYDLAKADRLLNFLTSGNYDVIEYENLDPKHPSKYFEIIPTDTLFSVPASGVNSYDLVPSVALDRLIAVKGNNKGWHLFGENSAEIIIKCKSGKLRCKGKLK